MPCGASAPVYGIRDPTDSRMSVCERGLRSFTHASKLNNASPLCFAGRVYRQRHNTSTPNPAPPTTLPPRPSPMMASVRTRTKTPPYLCCDAGRHEKALPSYRSNKSSKHCEIIEHGSTLSISLDRTSARYHGLHSSPTTVSR